MLKRSLILIALAIMATPAMAQTSFYTDRALQQVNVLTSPTPLTAAIPYGSVRVCSLPLTQAQPCLPLAIITDINGNPVSNSIGPLFGQLTTDATGRFTFGCTLGNNYQVQVTQSASNTPAVNYPITCPGIGTNPQFTSFTVTGTPGASLSDVEGVQVAPLGANLYGINNLTITLPDNPPVLPQVNPITVFNQYCRSYTDPTGHFGCGWSTKRWNTVGDGNFFNFESKYSPSLDLINSDPFVPISSVALNGNVVTVTTTTAHNLRATLGTANISGVTGCTGGFNPNGSHIGNVTSTSATTYTYPLVAANATCNTNVGFSAGPALVAIDFTSNKDSNNNLWIQWQLFDDVTLDRTHTFCIQQLTQDTLNGQCRAQFFQVNPILNVLGVGQGSANDQNLLFGNTRTGGLVTSVPLYNVTNGGSGFSFRDFTQTRETFIVSPGFNANNTLDICFNTARNTTGNCLWRFDNSGGVTTTNLADLWTSASDGGALIPLNPLGGLNVPAGKVLTIAGSVNPAVAAGTNLGSNSLPFANAFLSNGTNSVELVPAAMAASPRVVNIPDPLSTVILGMSLNTGTGVYQSKRGVAGCTTAASIGGTCATDITVTWTTAFVDANYSVTCTGSTPTAVPAAPFVVSATKLAATVHINYFAITAVAASYATIDCIAVHD